jgi:hypothetical protein
VKELARAEARQARNARSRRGEGMRGEGRRGGDVMMLGEVRCGDEGKMR